MSKQVGNFLLSDVYVQVNVMLVIQINFYTLYGTYNIKILRITYGPGNSVCIINDYKLDGPGSNPGGDEIFHPSRLALGPTQPPVQRVPGLSWGKRQPGRGGNPPPPSSTEVLERVELYLYSP